MKIPTQSNNFNSSIYKEYEEENNEKNSDKIKENEHFICNNCISSPNIIFKANNSFYMKCCKEEKNYGSEVKILTKIILIK